MSVLSHLFLLLTLMLCYQLILLTLWFLCSHEMSHSYEAMKFLFKKNKPKVLTYDDFKHYKIYIFS